MAYRTVSIVTCSVEMPMGLIKDVSEDGLVLVLHSDILFFTKCC